MAYLARSVTRQVFGLVLGVGPSAGGAGVCKMNCVNDHSIDELRGTD